MLIDTFDDTLVHLIQSGGVAVLRTDTLYGIVALASSEDAVARVYAAKGRTPTKSPIVLIAGPQDMFDDYDTATLRAIGDRWPGKNSIIMPSVQAPEWITRGNASVAYRIPDSEALRGLLAATGPIIAPSANPEGAPPAMTIDEARRYFGTTVDLYVDGGVVDDETPSRLFRITNGELERLR